MEYAKILANQVFIMFLLLAVGYLLFQLKLVSAATNSQLTSIILYVVMPCMILSTYQMDYDPDKARNLLLGFLVSAISLGIAIGVSYIVRINGDSKRVATEQFCVIFANCGFMAIPLISALFGQLGVFYCNTYLTMFNIIIWTYGVALMQKKEKNTEKITWKARIKPFITPVMISIVVGLATYFLQIRFPAPVESAINYIGSMNTPLAMIVSGIYIAQSDLKKALTNRRIYGMLLIKCFLIPFVLIVVFRQIPMDPTLAMVILIASSCPTASNSMLFADKYGQDVETASNIFTLTTLLSIISLPIVILLWNL